MIARRRSQAALAAHSTAVHHHHMIRPTPSWDLAERGASRREELQRKLKRRWRRVPDLESLRRSGMKIGHHVAAMNGVHLDPGRPWLLTIGDHVSFSLDVVVLTHDASMLQATGFARIAPVEIGSRVFVGAHAVILPGVTVGSDVVIAAGAVVTRDIPDGSVAAGVPARVVGTMSEFVRRTHDSVVDSPVWESAELPTGSLPEAEQRAALQELLRNGSGYVGRAK